MTICRAFDEWIDKKVDALEVDDKLWTLKCVGYGALSCLPDVLAVLGIYAIAQAGCNMIVGKGFTMNPKD